MERPAIIIDESMSIKEYLMRIVADCHIVGLSEFFSNLGTVQALPTTDIRPESLKNADVLLIRSKTKIDAALLNNTAIQFVGSCVSGTDHIDWAWLHRTDIKLASAQGSNANAVAEYVMSALILKCEQLNRPLNTLSLGIIGVGHVGRRLSQIATLLGMKVVAYDPPLAQRDDHFHSATFAQVLDTDVLSLHVPLVKNGDHATQNLLNQRVLRSTKATFLINTCRGEVVDEAALQHKSWDFLALDCWQNEPAINPHLLDNADLATPHIAGHSFQGKWLGTQMIAEQLYAHLNRSAEYKPLPPPIERQKIRLSLKNFSHAQQALAFFMKSVYNPWQDQLPTSNADLIASTFLNKRNDYPIRSEWCNADVQIETDSTITWGNDFICLLKQLGVRTQHVDFNRSASGFLANTSNQNKVPMKGGC